MKIVIPMSGFGERFRKAGYTVPKPLIEVEGKTIIQHVVEMFPGDHEFLFICNQDHLDTPSYRMREILNAIAPKGEVVGVAPHKYGPVYAVSKFFDKIGDNEEVIVNYCDFTCYWNFEDFTSFVRESKSDASLPCYRGFHPHMLGTTNYAFLREDGLWATDIKEKEPFTSDRMSEFASSGTFYFATGALLKHYFQACMDRDIKVNGEYYVSMAMKPMMDEGLRVSIYELQHFMQWGTPEDLHEYNEWSSAFRNLLKPRAAGAPRAGALLLPMAGLGSRFTQEGYTLTKPLIPVSGVPMVVQASKDLPSMERQVFVLRRDMPGVTDIVSRLESFFPQCRTVILEEVTDGQARTCMMGIPEVELEKPVTIGACDNGTLYDTERFDALMSDDTVDVVVWTKRGYPGAAKKPQGYGWLEVDGDRVVRASVKVPLNDPSKDPIIIGAFTFKRASDFVRAAEHLFESNVRVNGEVYVDSLINDAISLGLKVKVFEIDSYLCWGTPNDLRTFEYWQSCFHKWHSHPYDLAKDGRVDSDMLPRLKSGYEWKAPKRPKAEGASHYCAPTLACQVGNG